MSKKPYFRVTFYGDYYSSDNGIKSIKTYEETFNVSAEKAGGENNFWLYCVTSALPKVMAIIRAEKYPDFKGLRTYHMKGEPQGFNGAMVNLNIDDFAFKSREKLLEYIRVVGVPINADLIKSDIQLRELLTTYKDNRPNFDSKYKEILEKQAEEDELFGLNMEEIVETLAPPVQASQPVPPKVKSNPTNKNNVSSSLMGESMDDTIL
jgi:hypothetical protein